MKIKLFIILIFSFIASQIIAKTMFLANTPRLNTAFFLALKNAPLKLADTVQKSLASFNQKRAPESVQKTALKRLEQLPIQALNQVGTGVYAKEDKENNVVYIRITKDAQWEERIMIVDGKEIKVRFPKGMIK